MDKDKLIEFAKDHDKMIEFAIEHCDIFPEDSYMGKYLRETLKMLQADPCEDVPDTNVGNKADGMTKEESIDIMKAIIYMLEPMYDTDRVEEAVSMAIKALKQESPLDKIRAEIEALPKTYPYVNHFDMYVKENDVKKIIDKYKAERKK